MLIVTSTILFVLATIHVGASLQQLLDAFVYAPPDVPDYSMIYWLDFDTTPGALKNNLYDTLVCDASVLIYQGYADGSNKGVCPGLYYSEFNAATMA